MIDARKRRVWRFQANITTDDILPGQYLDRSNEEVGRFCMAGIDPDFVKKIGPGDLIVAGANFGRGSGRESAAIALQAAGIAAVIAPSFSRIFFRNAINIGLPVIVIESTEEIREGDYLVVDLSSRVVSNPQRGSQYRITNLTGTSFEVLRAGGIIPFTKTRMRKAG